jgi:hypothetical protein
LSQNKASVTIKLAETAMAVNRIIRPVELPENFPIDGDIPYPPLDRRNVEQRGSIRRPALR